MPNDLIPTTAQRHREAVERAEEFFLRNPTLQGAVSKLKLIAGETIVDDMIKHSENLVDAAKFFMKDLEDCQEALCNTQEELDMFKADAVEKEREKIEG